MTFFKYYRVYKNRTEVAEVSVNDFHRPIPKGKERSLGSTSYHLPSDNMMYYEYTGIVGAMERAKSGALKYITALIKEGEAGVARLLQYRVDNYENLNVSLVESNIRRIEKEIKGL
ncbi:hypothetical protein [Desertivirga brevis]|uniref:hypothetical protein n=1 Tax=Desertivirga brevis TaxID=2810310 RepID=UPI001A95C903|nr:hypothetical protein [Pedobacter sp. SYSU D00873]